MLVGPEWVLEYLRNPKGKPGNTKEGRVFTSKARSEQVVVTIICDACQSKKDYAFNNDLRRIISQAAEHERLYGGHRCWGCMQKLKNLATQATKNSEAWKAKQIKKPSWQSKADPEQLEAWIKKGSDSRKKKNDSKTPHERGQGVRKQWETMSEEVKMERAAKISKQAKIWWASLSEEERDTQIRKMVKGLPRSKVSDEFKQSLIQHNLYTGFTSEIVVGGFVADEVDIQRKLVIEFYGDYFHCNPRIYTDPNFFNTTIHMTAAEKWKYDYRRLAAFRKNGYKVLIVWEQDWRKQPLAVIQRVVEFTTEE